MTGQSPYVAAVLSFVVPGLGQLLNGERAKGVAILCITAGMWAGLLMATIGPSAARSVLTICLLGFAYIFVWIPAIMDAYQRASGMRTSLFSGEKVWYVIFMLLMVGPMGLPLLWQSPRFSRRAKLIWTIAIILIALVGILMLVVLGPLVERFLRDTPTLLGAP